MQRHQHAMASHRSAAGDGACMGCADVRGGGRQCEDMRVEEFRQAERRRLRSSPHAAALRRTGHFLECCG